MNNAWFDFVWVQFYNNYCSVQGGNFNFDTWDNWAKTQSKNPNVKVFLGVPGSTTAANSGYVPYATLTGTIDSLKSQYKSFGGVMMWDASQAYANTDGTPNYATAVSSYLHNGQSSGGGSSSSSSSSAPTSTTKSSGSSTTATTTSSSASATATGSTSCPTAGGSCTSGYACAGNQVAVCDNGKWVLQACASGLVCSASADGSSVYCNYGSGSSQTCSATSSKAKTLAATSSNQGIPKTKSANAQVSYFVDSAKNNQFQASFNVRAKGSKPISNSWTLTFNVPEGQTVQKSTVGKVTQSGNTVTVKANRKKIPSVSEAVVVDIVGTHNGTVFQGVDPSTINFSW